MSNDVKVNYYSVVPAEVTRDEQELEQGEIKQHF